jgi:hypothetical protein
VEVPLIEEPTFACTLKMPLQPPGPAVTTAGTEPVPRDPLKLSLAAQELFRLLARVDANAGTYAAPTGDTVVVICVFLSPVERLILAGD